MIQTYDISQLRPYINWPYFFFAWQVKDPSEKELLRQESEVFLDTLEGNYHAHALFLLLDAYSDGDDIIVFRGMRNEECGMRIPCACASSKASLPTFVSQTLSAL